MLLIIGDNIRIPMSDELLDRVAEMLQKCATEGGGFWVTGNLTTEQDGHRTDADADRGHQRLWVHPSQLITLIYNRPHDADAALPSNVIPFGPRR